MFNIHTLNAANGIHTFFLSLLLSPNVVTILSFPTKYYLADFVIKIVHVVCIVNITMLR